MLRMPSQCTLARLDTSVPRRSLPAFAVRQVLLSAPKQRKSFRCILFVRCPFPARRLRRPVQCTLPRLVTPVPRRPLSASAVRQVLLSAPPTEDSPFRRKIRGCFTASYFFAISARFLPRRTTGEYYSNKNMPKCSERIKD